MEVETQTPEDRIVGKYVTLEDIEGFSIAIPDMIRRAVALETHNTLKADAIAQEAEQILKLLVVGDVWTDALEQKILREALAAAGRLTGRLSSLH